MPCQLGVLIVHGMGSERPDFADEVILELQGRIDDAAGICWRSAFWADLLSVKEDKLWKDISRDHDLDYVKIRKFVISAFGDAVAYQRVPGKGADIYTKIHERIHDHLVALRKELREGLGDTAQDKPLVVMAHSLGGYIMSNYIWDRQHHPSLKFGTSDFEVMKTLAGIVTFGCNISLFSLAYDPVVAIKFPPDELPDYFPVGTDPNKIKQAARWLNFYDPDDVLGYPLKPLSDSYNSTVSEDIDISAGGIFSSWNPLAHSEYWTDNDFTEPVAEMLTELLGLLDTR